MKKLAEPARVSRLDSISNEFVKIGRTRLFGSVEPGFGAQTIEVAESTMAQKRTFRRLTRSRLIVIGVSLAWDGSVAVSR